MAVRGLTIVVALAIRPLKGKVTGAAGTALTGSKGTLCAGLPADLPALDVPPVDLALSAALTTEPAPASGDFFGRVGTAAFCVILRADVPAAAFGVNLPRGCSVPTCLRGAGFFAGDFAADFAAVLTGAALRPTGFAVDFLFGVGLATALPAARVDADLPCVGLDLPSFCFGADGFLATAFVAAFATGLAAVFAAGLVAGLAVLRAGLADDLVLLTDRAAAPVGFTFAGAELCVLPTPFFCTLAGVELRVVFAISFHHSLAVAARCYNPSVLYRQARFWNTCTTTCRKLSGFVNVLTRLILWLLHLYKRWLSPLLGPRCRFHPSCSDYARIAVTRFGPWRGSLLAGWRVLRCQPLCTGGNDPVPEHFHLPHCRCHERPTDNH